MSGSLRVYCHQTVSSWILENHNDLESRRQFVMSDYLMDSHYSSLKAHRMRKRELEMLAERRVNTIRKVFSPSDDKHLLYEKDHAPAVVISEGATMLMPNGEKLKVLESTCDIEGNVVYIVDKTVEVESADIESKRYEAVCKWIDVEYGEIANFKEMEKYIQSKSPYDLETERRIKDIEDRYHKLLQPEPEPEPKLDTWGDYIKMEERMRSIEDARRAEDGSLVFESNGKRYEITLNNETFSYGNIIAGVVVAIPPIGFVALIAKLLFFGG